MNNKIVLTILTSSLYLVMNITSAAPSSKQTICHIPPDNPQNAKIIEVAPSAAKSHKQQHGDLNLSDGEKEGPLGSASCSDNIDNDCNGFVDAADPGCKRLFKYVFITSQVFNGNLNGLDGADQICNDAVANAISSNPKLVGAQPFTAWLSSSTTRASDRVTLGAVEYYLTDGTTLAFDDVPSPSSQNPVNPINITELGTPVDSSIYAWTGTTNGFALPGFNCSNWTNSGSQPGLVGSSTQTDHNWSDQTSLSCNTANVHLYCFEE